MTQRVEPAARTKHRQISAGDVRRYFLERLYEHLSKLDGDRLEQILPLFERSEDGRARLSECLEALHGGGTTKDPQADFRAFRSRVNRKARDGGIELSIHVDTKKRSPDDQRFCWFEGPDLTPDRIASFSQQRVADLDTRTVIRARAIPTTGESLDRDKTAVTFFVSCDESERKIAEQLLAKLKEHFGSSRHYAYDTWDRARILVGENRATEIEAGLEQSDFGLMLVSPAYLAGSTGRQDLGVLVRGAPRPVFPVVLKNVGPKHDQRGLEELELFRLPSHRGPDRSFADCKSQQRDRFVEQLWFQIEERLDHGFRSPVERAPSVRRESEERDRETLARALLGDDRTHEKNKGIFVKPFLAPIGFRDTVSPDAGPARLESRSQDALDFLESWATDRDGPLFCAVLGEYGIGKTTTLEQLTRRLLERRASDASVPLPIFIDLRYFSETVHEGRVPKLEALLNEVLDRTWQVPEASKFTAADILRMVREERALLIFDGLDEKLVHLNETQGHEFIRQLWGALPPFLFRAASREKPDEAEAASARVGRLLFSCRSHYFKTLRDQNSAFTGHDRDGIRSADYRACVLLPFDEAQIREYLGQVIGAERVDAALELFASVHDLTELSRRPYLLSLITDHIGDLEARRARGDVVRGTTLYDLLVHRWLSRDSGKHRILPEDKLRLMESLAAAMWRERATEWPWERVHEWLGGCLASDPALLARYAGQDPAVIEEDFRTATFVLRPDTSHEHFRFAHTSMHEFFLARSLYRILREGRPDLCVMPMPSLETLDFLGQLLECAGRRERNDAIDTLGALLTGYRAQATELAFRYWLLAVERQLPEPAPDRVDLRGAELAGWHVRGRSAEDPLPLMGAILARARLDGARFEHVDLSGADLGRLTADGTEFHDVTVRDARVGEADLTGSTWKDCRLVPLQGSGSATWSGAEVIRGEIDPDGLPSGFPVLATVSRARGPSGSEIRIPEMAAEDGRAVVLEGHSNGVSACGFSPDGERIVSGSHDTTLKLWDARTGKCLRTLEGHSNRVSACGFSPDGERIVSGSYDNTLKLWDARTGKCLRTLEGHSNGVMACGFSSDGERIVSGSYDNTLKLWDARTGKCLRTLEGHSSRVSACGFSPDGERIVSGSYDNTLKLWDARTGKCLRTLEGHSSRVSACGFSPDGERIVSGSHDTTLKLWDARTGKCLRTLEGHSNRVWACGFSPDGERIVSGSHDTTLKLWDARTGKCLRTLEGHSNWVSACGFSPDGERIVSGSYDTTLKLWDARTGKCLRTLEGHSNWVSACGFSPDGERIVSGSYDNTLKLWDARTGKCLRTLEGHSNRVSACGFSPDGERIVSGSYDTTLKLWDARTDKCLRTLEGHSNRVRACGFSPDGERIVSGSSDTTLKLWDARTGKCLRTLKGHSNRVSACGFSPDGERIVSGSYDNTLKLWDARTGKCLRTLEGHSNRVMACGFSPDGERIVSGSYDNTLKLWDARTGKCLRTLEGHSKGVWACGFSPDGERIVSGSYDNTLKLWDVRTGKCLRTLEGHSKGVWACGFSPDGERIVSGSYDNTLKLWDAKTGKPLLTLVNSRDGETAAFDAQTGRIVFASPGAWRFLGWEWLDPATNTPRVLPAEHFGDLPS